MEDQLISFETALLAKDKGFDWGVLNFYYIHNKNLCQIGAKRWFPTQDCNKVSTQLSAPTQSLLQRWLRKIHNIDVQPICNYHYKLGKQYHLGIIFVNKDNKVDTIIIKETDKSLDTINRHYSSYEEALEEGLFQALNLIESK